MNAMEMRKSLLRSRALEFTRLLLLSQLEEADSTFWAMAAVLKAELTASCGTTPDHFLQLLAESIDELREKFAQRPSGSSQSAGCGHRQRRRAAADERKCAECLKTIPPNIAFYRSSQLCKNCYERRRVLIRKQTGGFQPLCSSCQQPAEGEMLDGKCIPCMYEEIQNKADEQPLDSAFNRSFIVS
ncbi:hypothetical protein M3Y99_01586800 [Aphelenchoides fujianensis]|nr:hypothetical protein M3Y99_01586800 [Aphelenchoides fujianensis]